MDIFVLISAIILLLTTTLTVYLLCKHKKIRALITSLVLHQIKEVGATSGETNSECTTLAYIGMTLTILSLIIFTFLHYRKSNFCKGHRFSKAVKIMIFISDEQNYVPITLCETAGSIPFIQSCRHIESQKHKINQELFMAYIRNRLERGQSDFQW